MLKKIILFISILFINISLFAQSDNVTRSTLKDDARFNFFYQKHSGDLFRAVSNKFTGFYLKDLTWKNNENKTKTLLIDFVKSVRVTGYTQVKKPSGNLSIVYYFPYTYDVELKDGTKIINASGRIPEFDSFEVDTEFGKEKCFTYFIRYWLEDKKVFSDNNSSDYGEKVDVPKELVVYLEFK